MIACSICLDDLKSPVATPCGHLHCDACLKTHIRSSPDPIYALCPTCRTSFPIVSPDLNFVPKKYHMFITPSVRRVYIEPPETEDLQNQVAQLEARVESLRRDKNMLMEKCESSLAKATKHAEGEKTARLQAQATQKDVQEMRKKYEAMKAKYQDLKAQKSTPPTHAVKRNSSQAALDTSAVAGPAPEWPSVSDPRRIEIVNNRPMLRIPKRPRIARAPPLDSPTEAVVPPTRPRFVDTTPIIFRRVFRAGHISNRSSPSEDEEEDFSSSASSSSSDEPETVGGREEEDLFVAGHGSVHFHPHQRAFRPLPARVRA